MPSSQIERKLAAIMFTDIAGYTALSAKDENKALELLDKQKQILTPIIEEYNGILHNKGGDSLLFTFSTVTDAVKCGIKIQKQIKAVEDLNLRIGIHEGEITLKDGDVLGDDVNIASRIEPFSAVGGISISGKIQQNISSLPEFETTYVGTPKLKGVSQEVKVYCITSHGLPQTDISKVSAKLKATDKKWSLTKKILFPLTGFILMIIGGVFWFIYPFLSISSGDVREYDASIAILYMENMSPEIKSYFADGLTEELINRLSRIQNLKVRPRTDVAAFKNKTATMNEISEKLKVNYIVEGSVKIVDNNLRVHVSLFDIAQDHMVWSNSYSNKLTDIFEIQDKIAENIVTILNKKLSISKKDIKATEKHPTESLEAYNLIQQAYDLIANDRISNERMLQKIIPLAEKAIALDSTYADTWAILALSKIIVSEQEQVNNIDSLRIEYDEGSLQAEKALLYDPNHELAMALTMIIPLMKIEKEGSVNLFLLRKIAIKMDQFIGKFPDSPFALSVSGVYYRIRYKYTDNESDLDLALNNLLRSHEILKHSLYNISDPMQIRAKFMNIENIPWIYIHNLDNHDLTRALKFIKDNKTMFCSDGTYECLGVVTLKKWEEWFYENKDYDEALEIVQFTMKRTREDLEIEDANPDVQVIAYWRAGMILMKWGKYHQAITNFQKGLDIVNKIGKEHSSLRKDQFLQMIGQSYYLKGDYLNSSDYLLRARKEWNLHAGDEFLINLYGLYGFSELINGNLVKSKEAISIVENWLKENPFTIENKDEYNFYFILLPLYNYYEKLNQTEKSHQYLKIAYDLIGKERILEYHNHSKKDIDPEFFYCRDIINTYESSLRNQILD